MTQEQSFKNPQAIDIDYKTGGFVYDDPRRRCSDTRVVRTVFSIAGILAGAATALILASKNNNPKGQNVP